MVALWARPQRRAFLSYITAGAFQAPRTGAAEPGALPFGTYTECTRIRTQPRSATDAGRGFSIELASGAHTGGKR